MVAGGSAGASNAKDGRGLREVCHLSDLVVTFVGTAAAMPEPGRESTSLAVNGSVMVDCGWAAPMAMRRLGLDPASVGLLLLSHTHLDHVAGLPALLFARFWRGMLAPAGEREAPVPLTVAGHAETLESFMHSLERFVEADQYPEGAFGERRLMPLVPGQTWAFDGLEIATCASIHPVPGLCYRLTSQASGTSVAISGDTAYNPELVRLARGVDLLIHEATYPTVPDPNPGLHSGAPEAARVAAEAGAGQLLLVHYPEATRERAKEAARQVFPSARGARDGEMVRVGGATRPPGDCSAS